MMDKTGFLSAVVALLLSLWTLTVLPSPAQAEEEVINVAVLNLEGEDVDAQLLETLTSVLRNEAQQHASYDMINESPVDLSEIVVVLGCETTSASCLAQASEQLEASVLIFGQVERLDNLHKVTVEVFDASSKKVEQRLVHTLDDAHDPVAAFRRQIQTLFDGEALEEGTRLHVDSSLEGAEIRINDTMVGTAPYERSGLPGGSYTIRVEHEGYKSWKASVQLAEGDDVRLWAPLKKQPGATAGEDEAAGDDESTAQKSAAEPEHDMVVEGPPDGGQGGHSNLGAWSAVGVGGVALGGSLVMALLMQGAEDELAEHEATLDEASSREAFIAESEDIVEKGQSYELAHRVLLGIGAASVVGGSIWLLVADDADESSLAAHEWDVQISPGGVSALWSW